MSHPAHAAPPLPEPRTPMWLPAVGAALFAIAGVGWLVCPAGGASTAPAASASADVSVARPATPAPPPAPATAPARPLQPPPAAIGSSLPSRMRRMPPPNGAAPTGGAP